MRKRIYWFLVIFIFSCGCLFPMHIPTSFHGYSSISKPDGVTQNTYEPTDPQDIFITSENITDRPYVVIGDISATAYAYGSPGGNPFAISEPSEEEVNEEIRKQAAEVGADAVILVRYGEVGVTPLSWKSLEGKGRAIKFVSK